MSCFPVKKFRFYYKEMRRKVIWRLNIIKFNQKGNVYFKNNPLEKNGGQQRWT